MMVFLFIIQLRKLSKRINSLANVITEAGEMSLVIGNYVRTMVGSRYPCAFIRGLLVEFNRSIRDSNLSITSLCFFGTRLDFLLDHAQQKLHLYSFVMLSFFTLILTRHSDYVSCNF